MITRNVFEFYEMMSSFYHPPIYSGIFMYSLLNYISDSNNTYEFLRVKY